MKNWKTRLPLAALTPFTLQDFPGKSACLLWFSGCQMRCPYCHNPELALGRAGRLGVERVLAFLKARSAYLDGVVLSGGECLLSPAVIPFIREVRALGYQIKVDTNGASSDQLERVLAEGLCDYVALDFKAPLDGYEALTGWGDTARWQRSFDLLRSAEVRWELRTTVHPDLLDESAVSRMLDYLDTAGFREILYLQHYRHGKTLGGVAEPSRRFDLQQLDLARSFSLGFRNFTDSEVAAASRVAACA